MAMQLIGTLDDFPKGQCTIIEVDRKSIGIYHLNDGIYALMNFCPHQGAKLCLGLTAPWVHSSNPGQFEYEREHEILRCPWHQWEFDIKTGCLVVDGKIRTKSYDVTVETFELSVDKHNVYITL